MDDLLVLEVADLRGARCLRPGVYVLGKTTVWQIVKQWLEGTTSLVRLRRIA